MKALQQLLKEKAVVESNIRAWRVKHIRVFYNNRRNAKADANLDKMVASMEKFIAMVAYDHQRFDDLLDEIETRIGL